MLTSEELRKLSTESLQALALERSANSPDQTIAVLEHLAERSHESGDYDSMADWYQQLAQYADDTKNDTTRATALYKVGFARFLEDKYPESIEAYEDAEELFSALFNDEMYLECLRAKMESYFADSKYIEATKIGEDLFSKALASENFFLAGKSAYIIAQSYEQLNYDSFYDLTDSLIESAKYYGQEARKLFENCGDSNLVSEVTSFLANLDIEEDPRLRLISIQESIDLLSENKHRTPDEEYELADRIESRGRIRFIMEDYDSAELDFKSALERFDYIDADIPFSLSGDRAVCYWQLAKIQFQKRVYREAQLLLNSALNYALLANNTEFYYRLLEDQAWALFQSDQERLALQVCNDAIETYEESDEKPFGSWVYCGFLIHKAEILVYFELWEIALETIQKVNSISDYFVPINRVIRIETLRAKALHGLDRLDECLDVLNATLNEVSEDAIDDEDIADCYELRGRILSSRGEESGIRDFQRALSYYKSREDNERSTEIEELIGNQSNKPKFVS